MYVLNCNITTAKRKQIAVFPFGDELISCSPQWSVCSCLFSYHVLLLSRSPKISTVVSEKVGSDLHIEQNEGPLFL
jgi:hypothetical protein